MKLSKDEIFSINALQMVSGVHAKDCILEGSSIAFLVKSEEMGKAIGKNGSNIKELGNKTGKKVEVIAFEESCEEFLKSAFSKAGIQKIEVRENDGKKTAIISASGENKRILLRNKPRLEKIKKLAERNYNVEDIKIR